LPSDIVDLIVASQATTETIFAPLGSQASGLTKKEMPLGAFSSAQMHFGIIGPNL
jgi:hypothetical protein